MSKDNYFKSKPKAVLYFKQILGIVFLWGTRGSFHSSSLDISGRHNLDLPLKDLTLT